MTVIVWSAKELRLAADQQATRGYIKSTNTCKIERFRDVLLATCGDGNNGRALKAWYKAGADKDKFPKYDKDAGATLIVIVGAYEVEIYDTSPHPLTPLAAPFLAWGVGAECALGALEYGADARGAVLAAAKHVEGCGNGVDVLDLEPQ